MKRTTRETHSPLLIPVKTNRSTIRYAANDFFFNEIRPCVNAQLHTIFIAKYDLQRQQSAQVEFYFSNEFVYYRGALKNR